MFNKQMILTQLEIQNDFELYNILNSNLQSDNNKINIQDENIHMDFDSTHNFYIITGNVCFDSNFIELEKGNEQCVFLRIPGNKKIIDERKKSLIQDRKFVGKGYDQECHRGHLLAEQFKGYTNFIDFNFSRKNPDNIYPQWVNANLNLAYKSKIYGQAYFENKVIKWLKQNAKVLYQVVPIFKIDNKNYNYPIGNVLIAIKIIDNNFKSKDSTVRCMSYKFDNKLNNNFFVFIPNYLDTDIVDKIVKKNFIK